MAKLSAHGGIVVFRAFAERDTPNDSLTTWERLTYAIRREANGTFRSLTKRDARFRPGPFDKAPYFHSWGWKVGRRLKADANFAALADKFRAKGFTVEFNLLGDK